MDTGERAAGDAGSGGATGPAGGAADRPPAGVAAGGAAGDAHRAASPARPEAEAVEIREVTTRADLDAFVRLPGRLAAADPSWVEPLHLERRRFLTPAGNPVLRRAEARLWLARRRGRPVGRLSAQLDPLVPDADGRRVGFFGLPAAADEAALLPLLARAEDWLRASGAGLVRGPLSLSVNQSCGLLVEGHETPPFLMTEHDPPHLAPAIERAGYAKARDIHACRLDVSGGLPDRLRPLAERPWPGLAIRPLDMRRYLDEVRTVTALFNDAWAGNWGFTPLTEADTDALARDLRPILDPHFVRIAEIDGRPAGFVVLLPNVNEALRGLGGRLLPFGWARLLWRLKVAGVRSARVPLMGVRREVAATPLGKLLPLRLIYALEPRAMARGIREVELGWLLEDNLPILRLVEQIGARRAKTWRLYEKRL